jgi:hypothetical protein
MAFCIATGSPEKFGEFLSTPANLNTAAPLMGAALFCGQKINITSAIPVGNVLGKLTSKCN